MDADRAMKFSEVAEFLSVSVATVYRLTDEGLIPCFSLGPRMRRVMLSDLKAYIGCPISNKAQQAPQTDRAAG